MIRRLILIILFPIIFFIVIIEYIVKVISMPIVWVITNNAGTLWQKSSIGDIIVDYILDK